MKSAGPDGERPIRVLLVDDEPYVRRALRDVLRLYPDIEVVGEAGSGKEAIALTRKRDPDVVLMDCRMAAKNGIEATRAIKKRRHPPRVVILTMHPETEAEARRAGADEFLLKGCPHDLLLQALDGGVGLRADEDGRRRSNGDSKHRGLRSPSPHPADRTAGVRREP